MTTSRYDNYFIHRSLSSDYEFSCQPGVVRYWELDKLEAQETKASKPARIVCKKCGAEGEHKTYECTVLIVSSIVLFDVRCADTSACSA